VCGILGYSHPLLLDTLSPDSVSSRKLFHTPFVGCLVHEHLERKANFGYHLWGLMTLLIWMKRWNIEAPEETGITQPILHAVSEVGSLSQRLA
jgi:asparagine synthase (glutamine-hydrolysing)